MKKVASLTTIHIRELVIQAIIGTRPEERLHSQDVILNISFNYDASLASQTDALGHAVDYGSLHDRIVREVALTQFLLLERLAAYILDLIMEDTRIIDASIVIDKSRVFKDVRSIAVEMSVSRSDVLSKKSSLRCY